MRSKTAAIGFLLIICGGLIAIGPTFGFSSVASDRGAQIHTTNSSAALLGIEHLDVVVADRQEPAEILRITNNVDEELELVAEVTIGDETVEEADGFETVLPSGESTTYAITCAPGGGSGETDVELSVYEAAGDGISIGGISETYQIDRECPGPSDPGSDGSRPPPEEVYDVRQEGWLDEREYIFEIVHDNAQGPSWDFGDGTTGDGYWIRHAYDEDGTYEVVLTVEIDGETYTYTETLDVDSEPSDDGPPAEEVYDIRQEEWLDEREHIFEIVHDNAQNPDWDFGDGTSDGGHWIRHTYDEDGSYEITLTVTVDGERYIYTDTVDVAT